jgi:glucose-1-phosphate thymidylyltransferase
VTQAAPHGIAQAFLIAEDFIAGEPCALILGANFFYGHQLPPVLRRALTLTDGAVIFAHRVRNPARYGVVEFDSSFRARAIEEKPQVPGSSWAVTALYIYDGNATAYARSLKPSARLEITEINNIVPATRASHVERLGRSYTWFDTGTHDALIEAAQFVQAIFHRQSLRISCVEEVVYRMGYIDQTQLQALGAAAKGSDYGQYLLEIAAERA